MKHSVKEKKILEPGNFVRKHPSNSLITPENSRKQEKYISFLLGILLIFLSWRYGWSRTIFVAPHGQVKTIHQALQIAADGDRIVIQKGIYREGNIVVEKFVEILGENWPVIDGENRYEIFTIRADRVVLRGLVLKNAGISFINDNAAVRLEGVRDCVIERNRFLHNFFAIYLANSGSCRISENEIVSFTTRESSAGNGIHLWYCKQITIEKNRIRGHRDGIYFEFVKESMIHENVSEGNLRYGLHFMFSDNCKYTQNTFRGNGAGVAVMYTRSVEMAGNQFRENRGSASFGLLLKEINDSWIHDNEFFKNTIGLYAEASDRNRIENNDFIRNGWAVKIMANSMNNLFKRNNFLENSFNVATNSRQNFNTFMENFWGNYQGYDLNGDGYGDVPFRPVRLFSFLVEQNPPTLILLRSFFIEMLDIAERILPILTPETLIDKKPLMQRIP